MGVPAATVGSGGAAAVFSSPPSFQTTSPLMRSSMRSIAMMNGRLLDLGGGGVDVVMRTVDVPES